MPFCRRRRSNQISTEPDTVKIVASSTSTSLNSVENELTNGKMTFNDQKYNFRGKVALVTGSSSGIGEAIATQLAQYGCSVAITGRDAEKLAQVGEKIKNLSNQDPMQVVGDLLDDSLPDQLICQTVETFGRLDFLINNAGGATPNGTLASGNLLDEWDQVIKLNVRSIVDLTQRAVPFLQKTKGNVINISSIAAIQPYSLVYSASKAALDMITKTSALELGPLGIRVNSINPGPVATAFTRSMNIDNDTAMGFFNKLTEVSMLKRVGQPEDIANLASFLVSDDARNITGSIYVSDSGFLIHGFNAMRGE